MDIRENQRSASALLLTSALLAWSLSSAASVLADEPPASPSLPAPASSSAPLRDRIDQAIESKAGGKVAAIADDAEFFRRIRIDLTGVIPSSAEVRAFLSDPTPTAEKRTKLIDQLLDGPEFARRMETFLNILWLERRPDKHVPAKEWREYLRASFDANKPYDQLVREILEADGTEHRERAKFLLDRDAEPNVLVRDVSRLFLGRDFQCCQCHDHPLVNDFRQADYYGLYAYVSRTSVFQPAGKSAILAEKGEGDVTFSSVFKKKITHSATPRVLEGKAAPEPSFVKGDEYLVKPADNVRPIPKHSRRARLGADLTAPDSQAFRRATANRLWAFLMGRGLVHPLDMDHGDNPPSHPELLDLLTEDIAARKFDVKGFLRELALTRAYQRSSAVPSGFSEEEAAPERFAVFALTPLSPEQLAWSLMQASGFVEGMASTVNQEIERDPRLKAIYETDDARRRLRTRMVEAAVFERLDPNVGGFVNTFGGAAGQPQETTGSSVQQALFLANGEPTRSWIGALANRIKAASNANGKTNDDDAAIEELFLAVLNRRPDPDEASAMKTHLAGRAAQRDAALKEMCWALVTSSEFRFKH